MGYIEGFSMGAGRVMISHLQFADDTMIFCDAESRQVAYPCCVLTCFEAVSGLKINLVKSERFQVKEDCDIESLAWILDCKIGNLSATYLGLPLGQAINHKLYASQ